MKTGERMIPVTPLQGFMQAIHLQKAEIEFTFNYANQKV